MDPVTRDALRAAEEAVRRLLERCRKGGPLYRRNPRVVAHVSRTGKWHLNAIASLRKVPDAPGDEGGGDRGAGRRA